MAYASDVFLQGGALTARLQSARATWSERRRRTQHYRKTLNELRALSDRELADIGVSRSNIPYVAEMAARDAN